ncbi:MAG: ThuA domain-containing protein, partial [Thermoanaerobaculia bacterium]|nr:ThuA domain-containing protein [Thermoanaerobaculia bacterium]
FYDHPEFGELLGGYFRRAVQQEHVFVLRVEDEGHPATRMLGPSWPIVDELYHFGRSVWSAEAPDEARDELFGNPIPVAFSRDRVRVLLSIDTAFTSLEGLENADIEPGGDYPQSWCRRFGDGRSFYSSLGHRADLWNADRVFRAHLVGGIRWALGLEAADCTPRGAR